VKKKDLNIIWAPGTDWIIQPGHPESPFRMETMEKIIREKGLKLQNPLPLSREQIGRYQFISPRVELKEAHYMAAGAMVMSCQKALKGEQALICSRPPGHHSPRLSYGTRGFCTINNEAIGLRFLLEENPDLRLALIDTDAHHGDGTEDIFFYEPRIRHFSIHQDGRTIFPGSGFAETTGAFNNIRNIPLPPGAGDSYLFQAIKELVLPEIEDFSPDLIIHVAGFDGHQDDFLSHLNYSETTLGLISTLLQPDITVIAGGYDCRRAVPQSFGALLNSLITSFTSQPPPSSSRISKHLQKIRADWQAGAEKFEGSPVPKKRNVSFFYDEEFFQEKRQEAFFPCSRCPGVLSINSHLDKTRHLIVASNDNCQQCQNRTEKLQKKRGASIIMGSNP